MNPNTSYESFFYGIETSISHDLGTNKHDFTILQGWFSLPLTQVFLARRLRLTETFSFLF